mmetsp:Transcript_13764/g.15099  ORF Transcript_13764/g.15099 Transcript_13764/m.15099 type:complete len:80 (+) Transcript_13764:168-407(+)
MKLNDNNNHNYNHNHNNHRYNTILIITTTTLTAKTTEQLSPKSIPIREEGESLLASGSVHQNRRLSQVILWSQYGISIE